MPPTPVYLPQTTNVFTGHLLIQFSIILNNFTLFIRPVPSTCTYILNALERGVYSICDSSVIFLKSEQWAPPQLEGPGN